MKKILLISLIIFVIKFDLAYANNFEYPDANLYKYDSNEVNLFNNFEKEIKNNVPRSHNYITDNKIINYVLKFNYNIDSYNNKFFTVFILNELANTVEKNVFSLSKNKTAINFIANHEFNNDFSNSSIKNKLLAWVLMRQSLSEDSQEYYIQRRINLLNSIVKNSPKYAAMALYMITCHEYIWLDITPKSLKLGIQGLEKVISTYPETEFAAYAHVLIAYQYTYHLKNYNSAIQYVKRAINYKNFYCGGQSDLYSDLYVPLLKAYKESNDMEMVKNILKKINKNSFNYVKIYTHYSKQ